MASKHVSLILNASLLCLLAAGFASATETGVGHAPDTLCRSGRTNPDQQAVVNACTQFAEHASSSADKADALMRLGYAPKSLGAYVAKAEWLTLSNDFTGAISLLEKAVDHNNRHVGAWIGLGRAYQGLGRFAESRAAFRRALALDNRDMLANYHFAELAAQLEQFEVAAQHFEQAAEHFNWQTGGADLGLMGIGDPLRRAATMLGQLGRPKDALVLLNRRFGSLPPQAIDGQLYAMRGKLHIELEQYAEAADDLRKALALLPPELRNGLENQLSLALRNSGKDTEANDRFMAVLDSGSLQQILRLQVFLKNRGFSDVTINGRADDPTRAAAQACVRQLTCTTSVGDAL
jgi:tetratricopeptide (TPR) repeat protein